MYIKCQISFSKTMLFSDEKLISYQLVLFLQLIISLMYIFFIRWYFAPKMPTSRVRPLLQKRSSTNWSLFRSESHNLSSLLVVQNVVGICVK